MLGRQERVIRDVVHQLSGAHVVVLVEVDATTCGLPLEVIQLVEVVALFPAVVTQEHTLFDEG